MKKDLSENIFHGSTYIVFFLAMALVLSKWGLTIDVNNLPSNTAQLLYSIVVPCIKVISSFYVLLTSLRFVLSDYSFYKKLTALIGVYFITCFVVFIL